MAEGQRADPFGAFVTTMEDGFLATLASSFLDKSPLCLAYFGLDRHCRFANPLYCQTFGLDPACITTTTLANVIGPETGERLSVLEAGVLAGETRPFSLAGSPSTSDRTNVTGCLIPHRDAG